MAAFFSSPAGIDNAFAYGLNLDVLLAVAMDELYLPLIANFWHENDAYGLGLIEPLILKWLQKKATA